MEQKQQPTLKEELLRIKRKQRELEERILNLENSSKKEPPFGSGIGGSYISYGGGVPEIKKGPINVQEIMGKK